MGKQIYSLLEIKKNKPKVVDLMDLTAEFNPINKKYVCGLNINEPLVVKKLF